MYTDPNNIGYWKDSHTEDATPEPTGIPGNINNKPAPQISNIDTVCAFMLYRDSATKAADGWDISPDFALPGMHQGQFCVSASFMDNPAAWLVNATDYDDRTDYPTDSNHNTNFLAVGAMNSTFEWDNTLSRCTFTNLHTPKTLRAEDMPEAGGNLTTTTIGDSGGQGGGRQCQVRVHLEMARHVQGGE